MRALHSVAIREADTARLPLSLGLAPSNSAHGLVEQALGADWERNPASESACAFRHADGTLLAVRISAAKPSWVTRKPCGARWDIGRRADADPAEAAEIHVFAHHPVWDEPSARDPMQWRFHVVAGRMLPGRRTLSLPAVAMLAARIGPVDLGPAIERLHRTSRPTGGGPIASVT